METERSIWNLLYPDFTLALDLCKDFAWFSLDTGIGLESKKLGAQKLERWRRYPKETPDK